MTTNRTVHRRRMLLAYLHNTGCTGAAEAMGCTKQNVLQVAQLDPAWDVASAMAQRVRDAENALYLARRDADRLLGKLDRYCKLCGEPMPHDVSHRWCYCSEECQQAARTARTAAYYEARTKAGLCRRAGCPSPPAPGQLMCKPCQREATAASARSLRRKRANR